ncbi:MAG: RsmD family RNA methyltransferase [Flavobacteriales bacterium]|nr:RsmD family RNA methyltransferase [Flavobacteriales bacterium]
MRIISGTHKGRKINPGNKLNLRPTTDRSKEALFNILENRYYFNNKNVLDLFSGTGNISLEFASRGTEEVIAVDNNFASVDFIENISDTFGLNISVFQSDCIKYINNCKNIFNFIFADPPYDYENYQEIPKLIIKNKLLKKDGLLIIEHDKNTVFNYEKVELRKYGTVHFSIFSL